MSLQRNETARRDFEMAVRMIQANAADKAEAFLRGSLKEHPNDPNLLRMLGVSLTRLGRLEEAERAFVHVTRLMPDFAPVYENLADAQIRQGKTDEAVKSLQAAVKRDPSLTSANQRLGELLAVAGRGIEADEIFQQYLDNNPDRQALVEAMELNRKGDTAKAEAIYRGILRRDPENVDALRLMGVLCVRKENFNDGEAFFRRAVEVAPDYWAAWINLGSALNDQQKFDKAEAAFKRALKVRPKSVHVLEKLGANSMNAGQLDDAVNWLDQALAIDEKHFPSLLCLGHALKTIGRQDEAIDAYKRCADSKPDFGEVYWSLANLKTFRFDDDEVEDMKSQLAEVAKIPAGEDSAISFSFALGKAYEDRKDYVQAFDYYARGNEKKRLKVQYDPIEFEKMNDRIIDVFSKDFFEKHAGQGCSDASPILIVGLPRSGSTLLEQILASHSEVEGTAELHYLLRLATETGFNRVDGIKYPECMHELTPYQIEDLGKEYIENTLPHRTGATYFTDKLPNNFTGIGFLHTILPNAKVIDARRHPLDSCLGTFKQLFARGQVFSYDFYDLAHYYAQYVRMIDHWNDVLPGKVLTVQYEDVVENLEANVMRIAEHCGLVFEDSMLRYHETKRAVKTASSEQVRQPIYKGSVNLWRHYEEQLEELIDFLEPVLLDLPNEQRPKSLQSV
ncbi:MAG: sulfotransferase [Pseudomonadota bacterium]